MIQWTHREMTLHLPGSRWEKLSQSGGVSTNCLVGRQGNGVLQGRLSQLHSFIVKRYR